MYFSMYLTADHLNETLFDEILIFYILLCCFGEKKIIELSIIEILYHICLSDKNYVHS